MGFRKFGTFNQALIAKQVWRIIEKPNSLLAQVFKSRYFRSEDIMEAKLGSNPSFAWRSICWGRELIKEGLGWTITNGKSIDAGKRDWFGSCAIANRSSCAIPNQKVKAYIDQNGNWKE